MNIATKLEKAARLIEDRGLTYGILEMPETGEVCMLGAIQRVAKPNGQLSYPTVRNKAVYWAAEAIKQTVHDAKTFGDDQSVVFLWNDGGGVDESGTLIRRTPQEAAAMLRKAAKLYREQA